ncbi:sensor histidine kinase [Pseudonocardia sp. GCM10023141]|uniref:sensor histidine kinase n=1 Tax=Pseudonocardia sp. GCM10023141 TaxID=3252653 RepID=UPI00360A684C
MPGPPPDLADERTVRAARRFGRAGFAYSGFFLLLPPVSGWVSGWPGPPQLTAVVLVLYVAGLGLHVWRVREHVRSLGRTAPLWFMIAAGSVGLALTLVALASSLTGFTWSIVSAVLLGDIVGGHRLRTTLGWVGSAAVVVLVAGYVVGIPAYEGTPLSAWFGSGLAAFYVASIWLIDVERLWWLKAVTDLDDSRRTAAELATTRERLRLADDLHDILGHALEVVAFKSELASRLLDVDPARARTEMDDVQRVARESLTEVRAMVRDTRGTDLASEVAGARAVLESAGVALDVHGDPSIVGPLSRNVLGRVLREAMTNVLRHAQPTRCSIDIELVGEGARLRVVNDGAAPPDGSDPGTGLVALERYLGEHGGRLVAGPGADRTFAVTADLPVAAR